MVAAQLFMCMPKFVCTQVREIIKAFLTFADKELCFAANVGGPVKELSI